MRSLHALSRSLFTLVAAAGIAASASAGTLSSGQLDEQKVTEYSTLSESGSPEIAPDASPIDSNGSVNPDTQSGPVAMLTVEKAEPNLYLGGSAPEPASLFLVGAGLIAVASFAARRMLSRRG